MKKKCGQVWLQLMLCVCFDNVGWPTEHLADKNLHHLLPTIFHGKWNKKTKKNQQTPMSIKMETGD